MEKTIKTIAEQVEENKDKAQTIAGFIFEQFPYIESIGICLGSDGEANAVANITSLHELLCIRKNLRKWRTYTLDTDYALRWLRAIEGVWRQGEDGAWQHVSGGV